MVYQTIEIGLLRQRPECGILNSVPLSAELYCMRVVIRSGPMLTTILMSAPRLVRTLAAATLGVSLFAVTTADVPAALARPLPVDQRIARLDAFFRKYRCPEPRYVREYLRAADANHLDYRLLPAISIRETQCGVHETANNRFGFHPGEGSFPSVSEGIDFMAQRLAGHPYYAGKNLDAKLFTYNPRPAYPGEVKRIMSEIE